MKACIICDALLKDQRYQHILNHYLCSDQCCNYYSEIVYYDEKKNRLDVDIDMLNGIRKEIIGIDILMGYEIDERIDK